MAAETKNEKLETLRKRAEELKARIAQEEAKEKGKSRKEDTRLKVLVGAAFLADIERNPETRSVIAEVLKRGIVAPKDKEFLKGKGWL